jgi:hypothetical protein
MGGGISMDMLRLGLFSVLIFAACGGGSESSSSTDTNITQCGDFTVDIGDVPEIVAAAQDSGVDVVDSVPDSSSSSSSSGLQDSQIRLAKVGEGVVIAACGGTVIGNDTQDNDTTTQAQRLKKLIADGSVSSIEVK